MNRKVADWWCIMADLVDSQEFEIRFFTKKINGFVLLWAEYPLKKTFVWRFRWVVSKIIIQQEMMMMMREPTQMSSMITAISVCLFQMDLKIYRVHLGGDLFSAINWSQRSTLVFLIWEKSSSGWRGAFGHCHCHLRKSSHCRRCWRYFAPHSPLFTTETRWQTCTTVGMFPTRQFVLAFVEWTSRPL